jgi:glucose/arabinose dehydrogenase
VARRIRRAIWPSAVFAILVAGLFAPVTPVLAADPNPQPFLAEDGQSSPDVTSAGGTPRTSLGTQAVGTLAVAAGLTETTAFSGLTFPTNIRFASDGRVFVAEKSGLIKVFASMSATSPTVFADLRGKVDDYWDRGLLGMTLAPNFPSDPYVYVAYTYDAPVGGTSPVWNDACPNPPGPTTDGCVVSSRVSRLQASGSGSLRHSTNRRSCLSLWAREMCLIYCLLCGPI